MQASSGIADLELHLTPFALGVQSGSCPLIPKVMVIPSNVVCTMNGCSSDAAPSGDEISFGL